MKRGIIDHLERLPLGYSKVYYLGRSYGLSKGSFNQGRSFKIYAEQLGGTDFVSANIYLTAQKDLLRPCEMPREKVLDFLENLEFEIDQEIKK